MPAGSGEKAVAGPAVAVFLAAFVSLGLYYNLWRMFAPGLHRPLATVFGLISWVAIGFGPTVIYYAGRSRGAGVPVLVAACLVTPVVWNVKEIVRVSVNFTLAESLYFGLNTVFLLMVCGAIGQMGICEIVYRLRDRPADTTPAAVFTRGPVGAILLALASVFVFLIWGGGTHAFYVFMEGYKLIFH